MPLQVFFGDIAWILAAAIIPNPLDTIGDTSITSPLPPSPIHRQHQHSPSPKHLRSFEYLGRRFLYTNADLYQLGAIAPLRDPESSVLVLNKNR
jgi:hypothetical protein